MPHHSETIWNDDDKMPFGVHKGERLGDIEDSYFVWLSQQDWCESRHPGLFEYAQLAVEEAED